MVYISSEDWEYTFEVWEYTIEDARHDAAVDPNLGEDEKLEPGWYWWPCSPGCLPDVTDGISEAVGPFETEDEAIDHLVDHFYQ